MSFLKRNGGYLLRLIVFHISPKLLAVILYLLFINHIEFKSCPNVSKTKLFISSSVIWIWFSKYNSLSVALSNSDDLIISSISIDDVNVGSGDTIHVKPIALLYSLSVENTSDFRLLLKVAMAQ